MVHRNAVGSGPGRYIPIQSALALLYVTFLGLGLLRLLFLELSVGGGLGDDIGEELKIVDSRNCRSYCRQSGWPSK